MIRRVQTPIALACAALLLSPAVRAQEAAAAPAAPVAAEPQPQGLETVTITAQRRAEVLSKAPVAVSVVSQKGLDSQGITAAADVPSTVPNLQMAGNGFAMRGIGNNNSFGGYSTVAVQVDGIYEPAYQVLGTGLYDIDRIEALRGPQGTVYGRNATAGVVNIETARAKSKFEAFGDVALGNYQDRTVRGVLNLPVSDTFQLRASVMKRKNDGYADGGAASSGYNAINVSSVRLAWNWQPTPDLRWRASLSNTQDNGTVPDSVRLSYTAYPNANLATGVLGQPVVVSPGGDILAFHTATDVRKNLSQNAFRSSLAWSLNDQWTVTYLAGATRLVDDGVAQNTGIFLLKSKDYTTATQSHEVDVNFEVDNLKVVGGLYHYRDKTTGSQKVGVGDALPAPLASVLPPGIAFGSSTGLQPTAVGIIDVGRRVNGDKNDSDAAFTQATWSVLPTTRLTAGLRYTRDKFSTDGDSQVCAYGSLDAPNPALNCGVPFGPPLSAVAAAKSSNTSWRLGLDHDLNREHLVYATVSTGYRGGGATANVAPQFLTYKPETLTSVELGWRGRLLRNTLGLNVSVFDMDYRDLQVSTIGQDSFGNNTPVTANAAKARIRGMEFEGDWLATRDDRLQGFFTYLDARFGTFLDPVAAGQNVNAIYNQFAPVPLAHVNADYTGHRLPNAPMFTARARYAHTFTLDGGARLVPALQVYWQAGSYTSLENYGDPALGYRKAYTKTDLSLGYESADRRWTVDGYIYNLENKKVVSNAVPLPAATVVSYLPPRLIGMRLGYRFQ